MCVIPCLSLIHIYVKDMLAPVIKLIPLTYEEMLVLTEKLADIHSGLFDYEKTLTETDLIDFIKIEFSRIGADTNITPREVIRDFIELLNIVYQNPGIDVYKRQDHAWKKMFYEEVFL